MAKDNVIISKNNLKLVKKIGHINIFSKKDDADNMYYIPTVEVNINEEESFCCIGFSDLKYACEEAYNRNLIFLSEWYIYKSKTSLIAEHGDYRGKSIKISTEKNYSKDDEEFLLKLIKSNKDIDKVHLENSKYGCYLWITFKII